jgi:hypothetical protein
LCLGYREPQIELISYALISEQQHAAALLREELIAALAQAWAADAPAVRESSAKHHQAASS